jgi:hypothetical protein
MAALPREGLRKQLLGAAEEDEWPAALYVLSWSDFVRYDPQGNVLVDSSSLGATPAIGAALWSAPLVPHYVKNVGNSDLRIIAIELKQP